MDEKKSRFEQYIHLDDRNSSIEPMIDLLLLESQWLCWNAPNRCRHSWIWTGFVAVWWMLLLDFVARTHFPRSEVPKWSQNSMILCSRQVPMMNEHNFSESFNWKRWQTFIFTSFGRALPSAVRCWHSSRSSYRESNIPHGFRLWHEYRMDTFFKLTIMLKISSSFGTSSPAIKLRQSSIASLYRFTHWSMIFERAMSHFVNMPLPSVHKNSNVFEHVSNTSRSLCINIMLPILSKNACKF